MDGKIYNSNKNVCSQTIKCVGLFKLANPPGGIYIDDKQRLGLRALAVGLEIDLCTQKVTVITCDQVIPYHSLQRNIMSRVKIVLSFVICCYFKSIAKEEATPVFCLWVWHFILDRIGFILHFNISWYRTAIDSLKSKSHC